MADSKKSSSKETASQLMAVIQTLSNSSDLDQREKEKSKLEKSFKESDKKLDVLVTEKHKDLLQILQAFSDISKRITASQERIRAIKDSLQSCKNLMHCKRDELRKLWIEGIEHKTIVSMLDQIEAVKDVPDKLQNYTEKKHYLHATELLVNSVNQLEGDLVEVEALRTVKSELTTRREELHQELLEVLHKQIYIKSTSGVVKDFQRQGSLRQSKRERDKTSLIKVIAMAHASQGTPEPSTADDTLTMLNGVSLKDVAEPKEISEDVNLDPDLDPIHFIAILVECLAQLNKLPEAIDAIRTGIRPGLLNIVQRSAQQVADNAYLLEGENVANEYHPEYLLELLNLIFQQFRIVARMHEIVLANFVRVKTTSTLPELCLYDVNEVWFKIQAVLQVFLSDYLDLRNTASAQSQGHMNFDELPKDIGSFFAKKKPIRTKKFPLFRFDHSSHAISMNSYLREQRQEFYGSGEILGSGGGSDASNQQFVCRPGASNITVIYNPLQSFMKEIEIATKGGPGGCTLQGFVRDFIKDVFLSQVRDNVQNHIDSATRGYDSQRVVIDQRTQRELGVPKPLLQSTVVVYKNIQDLQQLMRELPDYADQFLNMICRILQDYRDICQAAYRNIVVSDSEEKRIISATWAKDEDISRLLRCLPNWLSLKEGEGDMSTEISEEDMRGLNSKESTILTRNLSSGEALIPQQEIIVEVAQLRTLGNMAESLEWLCGQIELLAESLSQKDGNVTNLPTDKLSLAVAESTLKSLLSQAKDFMDIAETCLLVLHLEVRVHCFYHLLPLAKHSNYCGAIDDMDPDSNVIRLNKDLSNIEENMVQSLQPRKFKYIFEGLGHLVASILINSTQYLKRINENGIKKMCRNIFAVQQCLTNITSNRETDLDIARQYYELLYLTPEEILKKIVEQGAQYSEQEYSNLLQLAHRSERVSKDEDLQLRLKKLEDILADIESMA